MVGSEQLEPLFPEPEHWQRAERLIAEINDLGAEFVDCSVVATNSTLDALDGYARLIKSAERRGDTEEAARREKAMREIEIKSATETGVYVSLIANSYETYDAVKVRIFRLFEQYRAVRLSDDYFGDSKLPQNPTGKPFSPDENFLGVDLFFTCKEE